MEGRDILVQIDGRFERWFGHKNYRVLQHRRCKAKGKPIAFWLENFDGFYARMDYDFEGFDSDAIKIHQGDIIEKPFARLRGTNG